MKDTTSSKRSRTRKSPQRSARVAVRRSTKIEPALSDFEFDEKTARVLLLVLEGFVHNTMSQDQLALIFMHAHRRIEEMDIKNGSEVLKKFASWAERIRKRNPLVRCGMC